MSAALNELEAQLQVIGGGIAGQWGQTYNAFRLSTATQNALISGTPLISNYLARVRKSSAKQAIENTTFELEVFESDCDIRQLRFGDVLVETGSGSDGGAYAYAEHRPTRERLFVRVERLGNLYRPSGAAGTFVQQPTSGSVLAAGKIGAQRKTALIATLTDGVYAFSEANSTAATIPFGLQPQNRPRQPHALGLPTDTLDVQFVGYLPLLPGITLRPNDEIVDTNDSTIPRYLIVQIYTSTVGLQGNVVLLRREGP